MRRVIVLLAATTPGLLLGVVAACAPILGIQSRSDGPTWCQEDAQATTSAYCDDFDYVPPSTTTQEITAKLNGSLSITDTTASSPPNSLALVSPALAKGEGILAGHLIALPTMGGTGGGTGALQPFECQADILSADILALTKSGVTIGLMGVGAQLVSSEAPGVVVLSIGPGAIVSYSFDALPGDTLPPNPIDVCTKKHDASRDILGDWVTVSLRFDPETAVGEGALDAASSESCTLSAKGHGGDAGRMDRYVVFTSIGAFDLPPLLLEAAAFIPQPYFVYGLLEGSGSAVQAAAFHFDNVKCEVKPGTP
jgi:hypothetical protein